MSETKQELLMSDISDYVRAKDASVRLQNCIIQICEDLGRFPTVAEVVLRGQKDLSKYSYIGKKSLSDLENLLKFEDIVFRTCLMGHLCIYPPNHLHWHLLLL